LSLIVIVVASEVGRWLGVRAGTRGEENVLTLDGAVLGLLALMIGFTFATQIIVGAAINGLLSYISSDSNRVLPSPLRRRIPLTRTHERSCRDGYAAAHPRSKYPYESDGLPHFHKRRDIVPIY